MRYESHLARLFHRDLHELERLKAARNGQPVAVPMVMDIDLAGVADGSPACRGENTVLQNELPFSASYK